MKKTIWIFNHYSTNMYFEESGRHFWFSKILIDRGYDVKIFTASTNHFSNEHIEVRKNNYRYLVKQNVPFIFIKTPKYKK